MIIKHLAKCGIMHFFIGTSIFWTATLLPNFSWAQTDTTKINQLKDVQINQLRLSKQHLSPTPLQVLSGLELQRLNSLSIADAVRYFSGVQVKDYGGIAGLKTINVRSMGSNHTAVFYDGVQLGNAQNGQVDLGKYTLDNIDELSLTSGQRAELLQPAKAFASASSLFIKTKVPSFNNKLQNFSADVKGGSFGLANVSALYEQKLRKNLALFVNAAFLNANGKYKYRYTNGYYDTTVVRTNADIYSYRLEGGVHGRAGQEGQWYVKVYQYQSERGIPGAIVSNKFDFSQRQWDDNIFVQTHYEHKLSNRYSLSLYAKYANDYTRYNDPTIKSDKGALNNIYKQQEMYFSFANVYRVADPLYFSFSSDYSFQTLDANLEYFAYPSRNTGLFVLAGKYVQKRFEFQANVLATLITEKVKTFSAAGNRVEYTPTTMFSWQPFQTPNFRLKGFYKSIFRMPTFNDLYYTFIGNTNLRPEYTKQYDLGFNYNTHVLAGTLKNFSIQTDVYYNQVKDKIVAVPTLNLFRWTMLNLDAVSIKGLETNIKALWLIDRFELITNLNYTFEKALDVTKTGFTYRNQIPYIPVHSGSFTSSLAYTHYSLNYSFIYTGERYSQKANIPVNYVKPYYTHDVSINANFGKLKNYKVTAEINNLFNQYYDVVLNYPMPGRNFRFTISTKI
ncbi:Outer membrane cobalamin receptor protein [Pedobacter rhizosphaerae]|uniref:Outer membrane cobalamin receptor protein n=2 Tax=Pedobacter rhizosphaerae TaxID=390241 RepID=A0A1H9MA10_9SPHI|nr:Outer membrane cobalamin receptor protein [Pedobacter rhizosphaerae]